MAHIIKGLFRQPYTHIPNLIRRTHPSDYPNPWIARVRAMYNSHVLENYAGNPYEEPDDSTWNFDFLTPSLDPLLTFTRTGVATRFNSSGVLVSAAVDEPRFNYNPATLALRGLLNEETRTNLALNSSAFEGGSYTREASTVTADQIAGPDGTNTADLFTASGGAGCSVYQYFAPVTNPAAYTSSFHVKKGNNTWVYIRMQSAALQTAYFNLDTGVVGTVTAGLSNVTITPLKDGWFRVSATHTTAAADDYVGMGCADADGSPVCTAGKTMYLWGMQFELGAFHTSYIPVAGTAVVRGHDMLSLVGTNFSNDWNPLEGTLFIEADLHSIAIAATPLLVNNSLDTSNERMFMNVTITTGAATDFVIDGGVSQLTYGAALGNHVGGNVPFKRALAYKLNDFAGCLNGGTIQSDSSGTLPTVDRFLIGRGNTGSLCNGHLRNVKYYNTRRTDLQELTT